MGMDIGHFGKIEYFNRSSVPEAVRKFFEGLLEDPHYTTAFGEDSAVILTFVDDLVNETEDKEVEDWVLNNLKPVADSNGFCRLFINW